MKKCKECGSLLPCVGSNANGICKECDEQFRYCYNKCKTPCRSKEEQKRMFNIINASWNDSN